MALRVSIVCRARLLFPAHPLAEDLIAQIPAAKISYLGMLKAGSTLRTFRDDVTLGFTAELSVHTTSEQFVLHLQS